jgi:hypothetical protein
MSLFKKTSSQEQEQQYQKVDWKSQHQGQHPLLAFKQMSIESKTDHIDQYQEVDPFQQAEAGKRTKEEYKKYGLKKYRPKWWKVNNKDNHLTLATKIDKFKGNKGIIIEIQEGTIIKNCRLQNKEKCQKIWKHIDPNNARNYWCVLDESTLEKSDDFPNKWVDTSIESDVFPDNVIFPNKTTFKQGKISVEDLEKHFWLPNAVPLKKPYFDRTKNRIKIRAFIS